MRPVSVNIFDEDKAMEEDYDGWVRISRRGDILHLKEDNGDLADRSIRISDELSVNERKNIERLILTVGSVCILLSTGAYLKA